MKLLSLCLFSQSVQCYTFANFTVIVCSCVGTVLTGAQADAQQILQVPFRECCMQRQLGPCLCLRTDLLFMCKSLQWVAHEGLARVVLYWTWSSRFRKQAHSSCRLCLHLESGRHMESTVQPLASSSYATRCSVNVVEADFMSGMMSSGQCDFCCLHRMVLTSVDTCHTASAQRYMYKEYSSVCACRDRRSSVL